MDCSSSVSSAQGQLPSKPAAARASQGKDAPQLHEKEARGQKDPAWKTELDILEMSFERFDDWDYSQPAKVLEVFQSLKQNQHNIEALLRDRAKRKDFSSPPLGQALHHWLNTLNAKIRNGLPVLKKFDLHGLQTMALGLTACISLGHPNLFAKQDAGSANPKPDSGNTAAIEDLKDACEELFEGFLAIKEDAQQECPGAVLNIHNLVARLTKSDLPTTKTMHQASARCFSLMRHWSSNPEATLERLGGDVEQGNIEAEIVKRAGKAAVQVESLCDPKHKLLPLNGDSRKVQSNRAALIKLVDWLGSPAAIDLYLRNGQEGIVALSSVGHLYSRLLHWHYMPLDAPTRAKLVTLFGAIARIDAQYKSRDYVQALSNFGGTLSEAVKPGRTALWKEASRNDLAPLEGAGQSILADMALLSTAELDIRSSVPMFALLRSVEGWLARHDQARSGTTTTTNTTTTTTTTATTSVMAGPDAASSALAASSDGMELIRKSLGPAVNGLLPSLTLDAMRTQKRPDHITAVLDILCWLSRSPELVGDLKPLLDELIERLCACTGDWPSSSRASVAGNLAGLIEHKLVSESEDLYRAVLGRPEPGKKHGPLDLLAAAKDVEALNMAKPLAFKMPAQTPVQNSSPPAAQGAMSGAPAKSSKPKPTYRGRTPTSTPAPRKEPVPTPEPRYRKLTASVMPPAPLPSQPLATVFVDEEERDRMAREEASKGQPKASTPEAKKAASGRNKKKNKAAGSGAATKLSSKQAKAVGDAQLKTFEDELKAALQEMPEPVGDATPRSAVAPARAVKRAAKPTQTQTMVARPAGAGKDQSEFPPLPVELAAYVDAMAEGSLDQKTTEGTLEALRLLADKGHARAKLRLSNLLWSGDVGIPDPMRAMVYLKDAANQGLADAQYALGEILGHRMGTEANSESERLLRLAVAGGHPEAGPSLASMLWADAGKLTDQKKAAELKAQAVELWRQAAGKGHVDSKFQLGRCYQQGEGIARDMLEGQRLLEEAGRDGHEKAKSVLASRQAREAKPAAKPASTQTAAPKAAPVAPVANQPASTPLNDGLDGLPQPLADNLRKLNRGQLPEALRPKVMAELHTEFVAENNSARYQVGVLAERGAYPRYPDKIVGRNLIIAAGANGLEAAHRHLRPLFETEGMEYLPGELACKLFRYGPATPKNEKDWVLEKLKTLAEQGNPSALYRLGLLLSEGSDELPRNIPESNMLILQAAKRNLKAAIRMLKLEGLNF